MKIPSYDKQFVVATTFKIGDCFKPIIEHRPLALQKLHIVLYQNPPNLKLIKQFALQTPALKSRKADCIALSTF